MLSQVPSKSRTGDEGESCIKRRVEEMRCAPLIPYSLLCFLLMLSTRLDNADTAIYKAQFFVFIFLSKTLSNRSRSRNSYNIAHSLEQGEYKRRISFFFFF